MELVVPETKIEMSEKMKESTFSIGNVAVILEILRSKMYSNPVRTVVQEITSNARDAHRERGNVHVPFIIKLPNQTDSTFYVRDFGPGLTPDRMENVFIQYGVSTKRGDNIQTGGFGLGAKSPWAYANQFLIESITAENGKNIKRCYAAVIDESRCGKLIQMATEETDEDQGVKISLAVRPQDYASFETWVRDRLSNWDWNGEPLPTVIGSRYGDFEFSKFTPAFSGTNADGRKWDLSYGTGITRVEAVVDGIPYNIQQESLGALSPRLNGMFRRHVRLFFGVGEITITANREDLDYQTPTVNKVKTRLAEIYDSLAEEVSKKINGAKNLWEANILFNDMKSEFADLAKAVKWQGIEIMGQSSFTTPTNIYEYKWQNSLKDKVKQSHEGNSLYFEKRVLVLINDLGTATPNRSRVRRALQETPDIDAVKVITFKTSSDTAVQADMLEDQKKWMKDVHFDKFEFGVLSKFEPLKEARLYKTADGTVQKRAPVRVRKFSPISRSSYLHIWPEIENADISDLEGYYVILKERESYIGEDERHISYEGMKELVKLLDNVEVLGVMQNFKKHIHEDMISLDTLVGEKYNELLKEIEFIGSPDSEKNIISNALSYNMVNLIRRNEDKVNEVFKTWIELSDKITANHQKLHRLERLGAYIGKKPDIKQDFRLTDLTESILKQYPLLTSINIDSLNGYGSVRNYAPNADAVLEYLK